MAKGVEIGDCGGGTLLRGVGSLERPRQRRGRLLGAEAAVGRLLGACPLSAVHAG